MDRDGYRKDSTPKSINWDKPNNKDRKNSTSKLAAKDNQKANSHDKM